MRKEYNRWNSPLVNPCVFYTHIPKVCLKYCLDGSSTVFESYFDNKTECLDWISGKLHGHVVSLEVNGENVYKR